MLVGDAAVRGSPVKVRTGPLAGMTGIVEQVVGGFKFVVMVDFIRRGVSVTLEGRMLGLIRPGCGGIAEPREEVEG